MSRYDDDIPEIFRRAMEEAGWTPDNDESDDKPPPRRPQIEIPRWWTNRWLWLVILIIVFLASLTWLVTTYTEWLWFQNLNFESVWLTQFLANVVMFIIFYVIAAVFLLANWLLARRMAMDSAPLGPPFLRLPAVRWLIVGGSLFLAYLLASAASGRALQFLRYFYRQPFNITDPIFNRDIAFYIFELPIFRFLHGWFIPLVILALIGVVAIFLVNNMPTLRNGRFQIQALPLAMRQSVAFLLVLLCLLWAVGYLFDIYELLYSTRGVVYGASYTDLNSNLLALRVQLVLMLILAGTVAYNFFRLDLRPVLAAGGLWLLATIFLGSLYPAIQQRYVVEPNELSLEREYIEHNIEFTRLGFGLANVERRPFEPIVEISLDDIAENQVALQSVRLWDYRPLQQTYQQLQELRPYYGFSEIDIDRYDINGERRQVMLAARELEGLDNPTWVNERLEFTHGYGVVMNPVDEVTPEGRPVFYIQDLPPQSNIDLEITRPEIYYGELNDKLAFVGSDLDEFSFPQGNENVYSSYAGKGGVPVGNFLRRLAFAFRFGEANLLLSQYITPETRAMFHRQIAERVQHIAPFLILDSDPYLIINDEGRLVWMIDAYTASRDYPYSMPSTIGTETIPPGINYIRNAVKATIDAYDGTVNFYIMDPDDPIIQSYQDIFPEMFQPFSAMPEDLQTHVRFPEGLFRIQTEQYLVYHMTDVQVFYNREDLWQIPLEIFDSNQQLMEPYYVTFPLPDEEEPEYLLIQPYTPAQRNNMIAWLAARNDPPNYGEIVAYELSKQELVFGPIQVEGRIDQEPEISQQFSLWNQQGSRVIRGNLIVMPINNSFLYVEPIYLLSDTSALPELKRVIVASGDRIAMRETLEGALLAMLSGEIVTEIVEEVDGGGADAPEGDSTTGGEDISGPTGDETIDQLISSANEHFLAAEEAQRNGDWSTYGRELEALRRDLARLLELTGEPVPEVEATPEG